jgi:hypothetical protein
MRDAAHVGSLDHEVFRTPFAVRPEFETWNTPGNYRRYTDVAFDTPQQWQQWLDSNRDRLYFTDIGGYKFFVVPEGYPAGASHGEG